MRLALLVATALATAAAAQATRPETPPSPSLARVVDIGHLSCSQYLALPEADRGLVLRYAAGEEGQELGAALHIVGTGV